MPQNRRQSAGAQNCRRGSEKLPDHYGYRSLGDVQSQNDGGRRCAGRSQDIGGADGLAIRANLQVDFTDKLQGSFWAKYSEDNDVPTGGYVFENCELDPAGLCPTDQFGRAITSPGVIDLFGELTDPHLNYGEHPGILNREQTSLTAKFDYGMDNGMEFTSITNYLDLDKSYIEDGDAFPVPIVVFGQAAETTQFSQEFRLSGEADRLIWAPETDRRPCPTG